MCLIAAFVSKHLVNSFDNSILKDRFVNGSGVAFQSSGFWPADAAPDDRVNSTIVPVEPSEHFATFSADDDLGERRTSFAIISASEPLLL